VRELPLPVLGAAAAVIVDGDSGAVLFEKDAHTPLPPASTTKIVTALLALEYGRLDEQIEVQLDGRAYWGSVMGLQNGDRFTLRDLLYGLLLPSGNDAAHVIAAHIGGTERDFADMMTRRMRELGLTESTFVNASGLGRAEANAVSAHDLAQVARHAMRNPEFVRIVNTRAWAARGSRVIGMGNGNGLLYSYPGSDGVKIGWGGRTAGNTIVGSAVRGGHRVIVALLNVPNRDAEAAALLNWAFNSFAWEGQ
jgi:D-alanyl-D-alanine carboxypeptidase (penicillin-binding protein 5/6)